MMRLYGTHHFVLPWLQRLLLCHGFELRRDSCKHMQTQQTNMHSITELAHIKATTSCITCWLSWLGALWHADNAPSRASYGFAVPKKRAKTALGVTSGSKRYDPPLMPAVATS